MLSNELSTAVAVFSALCVALALVGFVWMRKLAVYCRDAVEFVHAQNKNSISLRRMAEVEATLTELTDSYHALLDSHKKLRSRIGMRIVREEAHDAPGNGVDAATTTDKDALRKQLRAAGRL